MHAPMVVTLVVLLAVAVGVAVASRRAGVPPTVGLVVGGLVLGSIDVFSAWTGAAGVHLTRGVLFTVFLPGLVFEAAYHLEFAAFRRNARAILVLAVPGVVAAIGLTAGLVVASAPWAGVGGALGWPVALVFAATVAATDPIAVVALFKRLGAPGRLRVVIEGESLVNDGTGIVLFTIVYAAVTGGVTRVARGALTFVEVVGQGMAIGAAVGAASAFVLGRTREPVIGILVTAIAAYGSFLVADACGVSGVLSTVTAGMICGSFAAPRRMAAATRTAVESFWEYAAGALNSVVFLLIGLEARLPRLLPAWRPIAVAFVAMTAARAAVVFATAALLRPTRERLAWRWSVMLAWGGLRGALSVVLAGALPADFPGRELVVTMTFGAVLLSILLQGPSATRLLRALNLARVVGEPARQPAEPPPSPGGLDGRRDP